MATDEIGREGAKAFWDGMYAEKDQVWSGRVNPVLATEVADLEPGTVLDLGCGEGGDTIWFAERGWRVTALDISEVALARAQAHAESAGVADRAEWVQCDLTEEQPDGTFDLVSAQFLQSPIQYGRSELLAWAPTAVAPGGTLLAVSHAAFPPWSKHHHVEHNFPTPDEILEDLQLAPGEWEVQRCEVAEREGKGPGGEVATLYDSVIRVRRLP